MSKYPTTLCVFSLGVLSLPVAVQAANEGFVDGASATLQARNYYSVSYTHLTLPTTPYV